MPLKTSGRLAGGPWQTFHNSARMRLTRNEARRLAGWDDNAGLPPGAKEPSAPPFLTVDHPVTFGCLTKVKSLDWPAGETGDTAPHRRRGAPRPGAPRTGRPQPKPGPHTRKTGVTQTARQASTVSQGGGVALNAGLITRIRPGGTAANADTSLGASGTARHQVSYGPAIAAEGVSVFTGRSHVCAYSA